MHTSRKVQMLLLGVVCFFTFFVHNGVVYPDIMESRNLITAREMVEYDNWLVPTMNGVLRLEKPPLPTWIAAVVETVSPDNLCAQRAMAGLAATLLVFFLYAFASRLTKNRLYGFLSALVLCTSFNIILMGRTATWDIYCHSFMVGAIYFLYLAFEGEGRQWGRFLTAGTLMGLSFLSKGPVSFYALLLPFLVAYIILYRPSTKGKGWPLAAMILACIVISGWWPAYLYTCHPDMALAAADKESGAWLSHNVRPWYYYWKFFLESGVWSVMLVTALIWPYWLKRIRLRKEYLLTVVWTFAILVFLSLLPEKKTRYLLPILIPAAMVVAHLFLHWIRQLKTGKPMLKGEMTIYRLNGWLMATVGAVLPVATYVVFFAKGKMNIWVFALSTLLMLLILRTLCVAVIRTRPRQLLDGVVYLFLVVEVLLMPSVGNLFNNTEWKSIRGVRNVESLNDVPFYYPQGENLRIELVYEAGRRILPVALDTIDRVQSPFALVTTRPAEETLPPDFLERVSVKPIGLYDDNHRPKGSEFYSDIFIKHVTLVNTKKGT